MARKEEPINVNNIGWESLKERDALRNSDTDGNKILSGPRLGPAKGCCVYGTEHLGSTTGVELLDELSDHQLLKRTLGHAVTWSKNSSMQFLLTSAV